LSYFLVAIMPNLEPMFPIRQKSSKYSSLLLLLQGTSVIFVILLVIGGLMAVGLSICWPNDDFQGLIWRSLTGLFNPFDWIKVPAVSSEYQLLIPTVVLLIVSQIIIKLSPYPRLWSRIIIVSLILAITLRYLLWRTLETLNFSTILNGLFSLLLLGTELIVLGSSMIQLALVLTIKDRRKEADFYSQAVIKKQYLPTVDILIPTYNEPDFILKRTVIGCQAIDYPHKNIYILDDTNRPEIYHLALELNCNYIARQDRQHAKAGNLNNALRQTQAELVTVFDADFIPCTNFLTRTVGWFQNQQIALVQTPQSFYNADPIAHNLGLENIVTPDEELFYRHIQPAKDGVGSTVCAGTSFVVRRKALESVGYFNTESISEDYFTGIALSAKGYQVIYANEKLSAGLSAESLSAYLQQRLRWARGTLQAFFIKANPLTISGLTIPQRLAHLEGILSWFSPVGRLFSLLIPLLYTFGNIIPFQISIDATIYIFLPYMILQLATYHWLNLRSRSIIFSEILSIIICVPTALTVIKVLFRPFQQGFKVTPKGISRHIYQYNWRLSMPLFLFLTITIISIFFNLSNGKYQDNYLNLGLILASYNVIIILAALIALFDAPLALETQYQTLKHPVKITNSQDLLRWGNLQKLSEKEAQILLDQPLDSGKIIVDIGEVDLCLSADLVAQEKCGKSWRITVKFEPMALSEQRKLITFLFCRPHRWSCQNTPGEIQSLWLLLKSFARGIELIGKSLPFFKSIFVKKTL
jgi:cellulose synthase (UDP-forming)